MSGIQELTRVFRSGSINLPDPDPGLSGEQVKDFYSVNHPHLATAMLEGPTIEGDKAVWTFVPAPVKTKG
jgi:PRTRC genetic system protein C